MDANDHFLRIEENRQAETDRRDSAIRLRAMQIVNDMKRSCQTQEGVGQFIDDYAIDTYATLVSILRSGSIESMMYGIAEKQAAAECWRDE